MATVAGSRARYDPWEDYYSRTVKGWMPISWRDHLPTHAATNGSVILLRRGLSPIEQRCALAHELVHIDLGHQTAQPPEIEHEVEQITARRLLDADDVEAEMRRADSEEAAAHALFVTPHVLRTFLQTS